MSELTRASMFRSPIFTGWEVNAVDGSGQIRSTFADADDNTYKTGSLKPLLIGIAPGQEELERSGRIFEIGE